MSNNRRNKRSLRERLAGPTTLYRAYAEVTSGANPDSAGPDGLTIEAFRRSFKSNLANLRQDIETGHYYPSPGRGVAIAKKAELGPIPGNIRPITVFNIRDRIVQRALSNLIWPKLRPHVYSDVSYGGIRSIKTRKPTKAGKAEQKSEANVRKNVQAAALRIMQLRKAGFSYTFETDIQSFFPSIDKNRLLSQLKNVLNDDSVLDLLEAAITTAVTNVDEIEARGLSEEWDALRGVPQGGGTFATPSEFLSGPI